MATNTGSAPNGYSPHSKLFLFLYKPGFALNKSFSMKPGKPLLHCPRVAAVSRAVCLQLEARGGTAALSLSGKKMSIIT